MDLVDVVDLVDKEEDVDGMDKREIRADGRSGQVIDKQMVTEADPRKMAGMVVADRMEAKTMRRLIRWLAIAGLPLLALAQTAPPANTAMRAPDDKLIVLGSDNDYQVVYDSSDNRLEFRDAAGNTISTLTDLGSTGALGAVRHDVVNGSYATQLTSAATANRAVVFPDAAGTVSLLGSTIETGEITDGTIVNADISASAAIAASKLAAGSSGQVLITSGSTPTWSTVASAGITDGTIVNADVNASAAIAVSKLAAGTEGYILKTVSGVPAWAAASSGSIGGTGPTTDNAVPRMDGTGGTTLQGYSSNTPTIDDDGLASLPGGLTVTGQVTLGYGSDNSRPLKLVASTSPEIEFYRGSATGANLRWVFGNSGGTESGTLTGNEFFLQARDITGTYSHDAFTVNANPAIGARFSGTAGTKRDLYVDGVYYAANDLAITNASGKLLLAALENGSATAGQVMGFNGTNWGPTSSGSANVSNLGAGTDNHVVRFDGSATPGATIQDSTVVIGDTGAVSGVSTLAATGQISTTQSTGTAPFAVSSTTKVSNLNADQLDGKDWTDPGTIGGTTPGAIHATSLALHQSSYASTISASSLTGNRTISVPDADGWIIRDGNSNGDILQWKDGVPCWNQMSGDGTMDENGELFLISTIPHTDLNESITGDWTFGDVVLGSGGTTAKVGDGTTSGEMDLDIRGVLSSTRALRYMTGASGSVFNIGISGTQSGSNAGANLSFVAYDDSSVLIDMPMIINRAAGSDIDVTRRIDSSVSTGTAPFAVASTTKVSNLNVDQVDGADWASPGNIGTGTPGTAAFTTASVTGQLTSTLSTGTAPFSIASTTKVSNLNVDQVDGGDWGSPGSFTSGLLVSDDQTLKFGTDSDIRVGYDEAGDDRLEWTDGTNLLAYMTDAGTTGSFGVSGTAYVNTLDNYSGAAATVFPNSTAINLGSSTTASRTVGIGSTSSVDAHTTLELITGKSGFQSTLAFKEAGTIKWRLRHIHGTDNLRIYSDTNGADLVTFGTTDIAVGSASTQTMTMTARFLPRQVNDAGPMTATGGTAGEIVYNTSNSKAYVCTVTHATAATWSALN